jgi:hypothetical protein
MKTILVRRFILAPFIIVGSSNQSLPTLTFNWNSSGPSRGPMIRDINTTPNSNTIFCTLKGSVITNCTTITLKSSSPAVYTTPDAGAGCGTADINKANYDYPAVQRPEMPPYYYLLFTQKYSKKPWKPHQPYCTVS